MRINNIANSYSFKGVRVSSELSDFMADLSEDQNPACTEIADKFEKTCSALNKMPYNFYLDFARNNHSGISVGLERGEDVIELHSYPYIDPRPKQVINNCLKDLKRLMFKGEKFKAREIKF